MSRRRASTRSRSAARGARGSARQPPLDLQRMRGVELAVEIGVDEQGRVVLCRGHDSSLAAVLGAVLDAFLCAFLGAFAGASFPMLAISRWRARASRDITVP